MRLLRPSGITVPPLNEIHGAILVPVQSHFLCDGHSEMRRASCAAMGDKFLDARRLSYQGFLGLTFTFLSHATCFSSGQESRHMCSAARILSIYTRGTCKM